MKKLGVLLLGVVGLSGCGVEDYVTGNNSSVLFRIVDINGGEVFYSDVAKDNGGIVADTIPVAFAVRPKNPNITTVPQVAMAVALERYEIRFYRSDGRATEGVDVPYRISGHLTTVVDASTTANTTLNLEFVRVQAKMEPPLRNLACGLLDEDGKEISCIGGQALAISAFAQLTVHGRTIAGEGVSATATVQINFSDFNDDVGN